MNFRQFLEQGSKASISGWGIGGAGKTGMKWIRKPERLSSTTPKIKPADDVYKGPKTKRIKPKKLFTKIGKI